jgi:hypothetical protein
MEIARGGSYAAVIIRSSSGLGARDRRRLPVCRIIIGRSTDEMDLECVGSSIG